MEPATKVLINSRMNLTWTMRSCPDSSKADKASQYCIPNTIQQLLAGEHAQMDSAALYSFKFQN